MTSDSVRLWFSFSLLLTGMIRRLNDADIGLQPHFLFDLQSPSSKSFEFLPNDPLCRISLLEWPKESLG